MNDMNNGEAFIADDFLLARENIEDVIIVPFDPKCAKGAGYNLSPCTLIYSVNKKRLLKVHENEKEVYVWVNPHDTILTISKEYIITKRNVVGVVLSRVRMSANGLGNVSTTIDPEWKGKLLLAISNPTKRRIKLIIEEKREGKLKTVPVVTMTLFKTGQNKENTLEISTLHLDNPPMRTDIWHDLIEKPAGLRGIQYEHFQQIIQQVTDFKAIKGNRYYELQRIIDKVMEVKKGIVRGDSVESIQALTVDLAYKMEQTDNDFFLKKKFTEWNSIIENAKSLKDLSKNERISTENRLLRECNYLIMCDEIEQHDQFIRHQIDQYWEGSELTNFIKKWISSNFVVLFAIILIFGILFWSEGYSIVEKVILSSITPIVTVIVEWISYKFMSKNH